LTEGSDLFKVDETSAPPYGQRTILAQFGINIHLKSRQWTAKIEKSVQ